jgi:ElaB/YqjD/DUF883 family membrane-anchored ribosome-binding protein
MADSNEGALGVNAHGETGMRAEGSRERPASIIAELVDATCSAAESLLEKQKQEIAERSDGIAKALRSAAHALDESENTALARYVEQTGDQIQDISRRVRERRWHEIVADTQDFARRQPIWFLLGAMATGFLVGRFIWAPDGAMRNGGGATPEVSSGETARIVTAAVAGESVTGASAAASGADGFPGTVETR